MLFNSMWKWKKKSILIHNVKTWIVCKTRLPLDNCLLCSLHWWKLKVQLTLFWTNLQFFLSLAKVDNDLTTFFPSHVPLKDKQTNKQTLFRTKDKILFIFLEKKILISIFSYVTWWRAKENHCFVFLTIL